MATSADAEIALAQVIAAAVNPYVPATAVIRGWPASKALDDTIAAGNAVVSIFRLDMSRNTTRYLGQPTSDVVPPPTLTASVSGNVATFAGTADVGQIAGVISAGIAYPVLTQAGDVPSSVVSRIAAIMPAPVMVSGPTLMAPDLEDARTAAGASTLTELGRQENTIQIDCWCPTPQLRDQLEMILLPVIAGATFLTMPDGSQARVRMGAVMPNDQASPSRIYRLMIRATVEVVLNAIEAATIALWPVADLVPNAETTPLASRLVAVSANTN